MLAQFASHPTREPLSYRTFSLSLTTIALSPQRFDNRVDSARTVFDESKSQWEEMIKRAQEEERNRHAASIPSFPAGSLGTTHPVHPYVPKRISFDWIETLGNGACGQVSKVKEKSTGRIYAQKVIKVTDPVLRSSADKYVKNEVDIMEKLSHLHIASVIFPYRDEDTLSIIMLPVADYDLLHFLQSRYAGVVFPKTELIHLTTWFGCLLSALDFAHSRSIKHDDIKPSDILIKEHQPYLADFGCAQDFSGLERSTSTDVLMFGTPVYWAPEKPPRGRKADVFSLGCVFSEMLTVRQGQTLGEYRRSRYLEHREHPYAFCENLPQVCKWLEQLKRSNDEVAELLIEQTMKMLEQDAEIRPDTKKIKRAFRVEGDAVFCTTCV